MKTFQVPTKNEVSAENQQIFDQLQTKLGFVPNIYATYALSDHALSRYLSFAQGPTSLSAKEREVVNLVVSQVNGCTYCLAAHTAIAKMNGFSDAEIIEFRKGFSPDLKWHSLVVLAKEITEQRGKISNQTLTQFYEQGFTDQHLVDLIVLVGEKSITNYLHKATNIPIDFPVAPELN